MICVLAFISMGHAWISGSNRLYKACYYDCGQKGGTNGLSYDRRYVVGPRSRCFRSFVVQ